MYYGTDTDLHGARLDVYVEPDGKGTGERATVYDVEPDRNEKEPDKKALPRRVRFYHGKIIAKSLNSGVDYNNLKDVIVIMILPYDPFKLGRMMYTVKNRCLEEPQMEYEDGASTLFLYTRGTKDIPSEKLKQFLGYIEKSTYDNAVNNDLKEVHRMVEIVRFDAETTISCVRLIEKLERSKKEGKEEGRAEGEAIGEARGEARGKIAGNLQRLVTQICKKIKLSQPLDKIAEDLVEEFSVIEPIYNAAKQFSPDYDPEAVLEELDRRKTDL